MRRSSPACVLLFAIFLLAAQSASALVTVGTGCDKKSIQDAINYVLDKERRATNDVDPYIAVAAGATTVYNEALTLDGSNIGSYNVFGTPYDHPFVQIYGDYDGTCTSEDNSSKAFLSGQGKNQSVLRVIGNRSVELVLNHLVLYSASFGGNGGGISFESAGSLDLTNVDIQNNHAGNGAGIYASGPAPGTTITLHANTSIFHNSAINGGGGINLNGGTYLKVLEAETLITDNSADIGGAIQVNGAEAVADIGSSGNLSVGGVGVIFSNTARLGGGIAVVNGGGLRLFSTDNALPAAIQSNTAYSQGGGLYVDGSHVCASGYAINGNTAGVSQVTNGDGSAIMTANSAGVDLNEQVLLASNGNATFPCGHGHPLPPTRIGCPQGGPCNTIDDNINIPVNFLNTITVSDFATIIADRFEARRNTAGAVVSAVGKAILGDCLVADNTTSFSPIFAKGHDVEINGCTIAGNVIGPSYPLVYMDNVGHTVTLANSILALNRYSNASGPVLSLFKASGTLTASDIIASETATLISGNTSSNVNSYDPRFVDAANGDYHLRPESPAVNYRLPGNPLPKDTDLDGNTRGRTLTFVVGNSAFDVGAYEVQNLSDTIFFNSFSPTP